MSLADQPAFAAFADTGGQKGMTYRQWLVGMALQGVAGPHLLSQASCDVIAANATKLADAAIRAQEKS